MQTSHTVGARVQNDHDADGASRGLAALQHTEVGYRQCTVTGSAKAAACIVIDGTLVSLSDRPVTPTVGQPGMRAAAAAA